MKETPNRVDNEIRALEDEMRRKYGKNSLNDLITPPSTYRSYVAPAFLRKLKPVLQWAAVALGLYYLFAPASYTVTLEGKLVAREMRRIDAKIGGEIVSVAKSNGDPVRVGEVIGRLYSATLHRETERLAAEVGVLETELQGLRQNLESEGELVGTYQRLFQAGDLARVQLSRQQIKAREAKNRLDVKEAELYERKIRLSNIQAQLVDEIIRSPFDGMIITPIEEKVNSLVREGESLGEVAFGGLQFEFGVKEDAVQSIALGQILAIDLEAFPGETFTAKVEEMRPIVHEENPKPWIKTYNVRVLASSVTPLPEGARIGMTARSRVAVKHRISRVMRWIQILKTRIKA